MSRVLALLSALLLVSGCAGTSSEAREAAGGWRGTEPQPVRDRPDFVLTDTAGQRWSFAEETGGAPTWLYFGYTDCPDQCPTAMADIAAALRRTDADLRDDVRVVFVTTDPARDDAARLRDWLGRFDASFVGLTGTAQEVAAAQEAVGVPPAQRGGPVPTLPGRPEAHEDETGTAPHTHDRPLGYAVEHAGVIFAYDVEDRLPVLYTAGVTAADLAADLPRLAGRT